MKKLLLTTTLLLTFLITVTGQTKQASNSSALTKGIKTINLINGLDISIEFNPDKETLWITGNTSKTKLFVTEFIPLTNPEGTRIEIGKSYILDNMFVYIEYKVLEITDNRVIRIWYRVAAKTLNLPEESWI